MTLVARTVVYIQLDRFYDYFTAVQPRMFWSTTATCTHLLHTQSVLKILVLQPVSATRICNRLRQHHTPVSNLDAIQLTDNVETSTHARHRLSLSRYI